MLWCVVEFSVDESCPSSGRQYSSSWHLLSRPRPTKLPAQGTATDVMNHLALFHGFFTLYVTGTSDFSSCFSVVYEGQLGNGNHTLRLLSIVRMPDETDAKKILTASPLENWRRPPGRSRTTWMKTIQQDQKSKNLSLNEAIDVAQNCPLWRLMSTFDATHS